MSKLQFKDLIEGEIYKIISKSGKKYIFRKRGDMSKYINYMYSISYYPNTHGSLNAEHNYSFPNEYEVCIGRDRKHFLQCELAGGYVEYKEPEFKDNYLIFN